MDLISDIKYYTKMADQETTRHSAVVSKLANYEDINTMDEIELRELLMQYRVYNSLIAQAVEYYEAEKKTPKWMFWK